MDVAQRIVAAIFCNKEDAYREGWDDYTRGVIDGLKEALAIQVGETEAARLIAERDDQTPGAFGPGTVFNPAVF